MAPAGPAECAGDGRAALDHLAAARTASAAGAARFLPGQTPLRRLTRLEYQNTVHDLLGVNADVATAFEPDRRLFLAGYTAGAVVTAPDASALMLAAERAAATVPGRLAEFLPSCCYPVPLAASGQDACARQFIAQFGLRAFRRPLSSAEVEGLFQLYSVQRRADVGEDFGGAIRVLVAAFLQSPELLYHWELGPDERAIPNGTLVHLERLPAGVAAVVPVLGVDARRPAAVRGGGR